MTDKQLKSFSHSSGGWKSEVKALVWLVFVRALFFQIHAASMMEGK
jgi:hypothetical protein